MRGEHRRPTPTTAPLGSRTSPIGATMAATLRLTRQSARPWMCVQPTWPFAVNPSPAATMSPPAPPPPNG